MFWGFAKDPGGTDWIAFLRTPQRNATTYLTWQNDAGRIHLAADLSPFALRSDRIHLWPNE